jgi:hypothetical protein
MHIKHNKAPNWKEEPMRHLEVVPDWESRMSNHTVAVSDFCEFCITQGEFARIKEEARWDFPMASLMNVEVIGAPDPRR